MIIATGSGGCNGKTDLLLVLDSSDFVKSTQFEQMIKAFSGAVAQSPLQVNDDRFRVGVIQFSDVAGVVSELTGDTIQIQESLQNMLHIGGELNIQAGIEEATNMLQDYGRCGGVEKIVIVLTSRKHTRGDQVTKYVSELESGTLATVISLGVMENVNIWDAPYYKREMMEIGSSNSTVPLATFEELSALMPELLDGICSQHVTVQCALPPEVTKYSLITKYNAHVGAHNIQHGFVIGGNLSDASPTEHARVFTHSFIGDQVFGDTWNFEGGKDYRPINDVLNWSHLEDVARRAVSDACGPHKVVVMNEGGEYNTYHFRFLGTGEDHGQTLVIFNTTEDIVLDSTQDGRQFGPSVLAPFSKVTLKDSAGYLDGYVIAREFNTTGKQAGQLQMHGNAYNGRIFCSV